MEVRNWNPGSDLTKGESKVITTFVDDKPECDGTDFAHPAFWRGEEYGVRGTVMRIRQILDGSDDGKGVIGNEELETLRRDILKLMNK